MGDRAADPVRAACIAFDVVGVATKAVPLPSLTAYRVS
jgi:hypothetical protein